MADVERLPDDAAVVKEKLTGSSDEEFIKMMGLEGTDNPAIGTKAGEQPEEGAEEEEVVDEKEEEEEQPESREERAKRAAEYKKGTRKVEAEAKEEEEVVDEAKEEEAESEEEAEAEAAKDEKPLLTTFAMKQGKTEVDIPRDVAFDFKANGKEYKDVPLDKVVLLAQMGFYNEAREQEVGLAKKYVSETQQENKQLRDLTDNLKKEFDDLLKDDEYYETAKAEYRRRNSPEERARRAEESVRQQRGITEAQARTTQAQGYIQSNILPAVGQILQTFQSSVSEDEVMGRFNRLITPYLVNGIVPIEHLPTVKHLVDVDLAQWAKAVSLEREGTVKKQADKAEKIVKAEKTKTTLAKRELARAVKPQGGTARTKEANKPKQYKSATEWSESAIDDILKGALP